jgi:hypothetical protein
MAAEAHIKQQERSFEHLRSRDEQELYSLVRRAHLVATLVEAEPGEEADILRTAVGAISEALEKAMKIMEIGRSDVRAVQTENRQPGVSGRSEP